MMNRNATGPDWQEPMGLLILRLGLAWFLFVWAVNKILAPVQYQKLWGYFHGIDIGTTLPFVMGGLCGLVVVAQPGSLVTGWVVGATVIGQMTE